jgi:D-3-phosphoglycerate dehydrogenase
MSLVGLLQAHLNVPLNIVNVRHVAESRGIQLRTVTAADGPSRGTQLAIVVTGPPGSVDPNTEPADQTRRIVGRVYTDMRPRVVEINGYFMDMVPAGVMVLIQNQDRPGVIGMVGTEFGAAGVNIADMAISRRGDTALMVLKVDNDPPESLLANLRRQPGLLKVAIVKLPAEPK